MRVLHAWAYSTLSNRVDTDRSPVLSYPAHFPSHGVCLWDTGRIRGESVTPRAVSISHWYLLQSALQQHAWTALDDHTQPLRSNVSTTRDEVDRNGLKANVLPGLGYDYH